MAALFLCAITGCNSPQPRENASPTRHDSVNPAPSLIDSLPTVVDSLPKSAELILRSADSGPIGADSIVKEVSRGNYEVGMEFPRFKGRNLTMPQKRFNRWVRKSIVDSIAWFPSEAMKVWRSWRNDRWLPEDYYLTPSSIYGAFDVIHFEGSIISVHEEIGWYFTGDMHPMDYELAFNFDLASGKEIHLLDLFTDKEAALHRISTLCIEKLLIGADKRSANGGAGPRADNFRAFCLSSDSLYIYFGRYQVGGGLTGSPTVAIPYSQLHDLFDPNGVMKRLVRL